MKSQPRIRQLKSLTAISFFRYFGTTFLIVGLVTRKLPAGLDDHPAFGDLIALVLAYIAFIGLQRSRAERPRLLPVWVLKRRRHCRPALCFWYRPLPYQGSGQLRLYIHYSDGVRAIPVTAHSTRLKFLRSRTRRTEDAITTTRKTR